MEKADFGSVIRMGASSVKYVESDDEVALCSECDGSGAMTGWPYAVPKKDEPYGYGYGEIPPAADTVNHPPHYTRGTIECIDAIEAALTAEEFRGYCKGNALKYIWRERHKGGDESVAKANWYLKRISK